MFDEMRSNGIAPPPEATAALIKALAKGGRGSSEALRLLGDMRASASMPQQGGGRVYLGGMPGGAAEAEADRERSEAAAQSAGFEGAIEACAVNGEWQKAVSLLDEMRLVRECVRARACGVFADDTTYTVVCRVFCMHACCLERGAVFLRQFVFS